MRMGARGGHGVGGAACKIHLSNSFANPLLK
jgi:hypothetical protein